LKQAKANGYTSRYIDIDAFLQAAEEALEKQSWLIEADRDYRQISDMIRLRSTRQLALEAFLEFRKQYPDYDPDSLADAYRSELESLRLGGGGSSRTVTGLYIPEGARLPAPQPGPAPALPPSQPPYTPSEPIINPRSTGTMHRLVDDRPGTGSLASAYAPLGGPSVALADMEMLEDTAQAPAVGLPLLEWCMVPAGSVRLMVQEKDGRVQERVVSLPAFQISKYPVTIAQYQLFLDDPSGYNNIAWWGYSAYANHWRMNNPAPKAAIILRRRPPASRAMTVLVRWSTGTTPWPSAIGPAPPWGGTSPCRPPRSGSVPSRGMTGAPIPGATASIKTAATPPRTKPLR